MPVNHTWLTGLFRLTVGTNGAGVRHHCRDYHHGRRRHCAAAHDDHGHGFYALPSAVVER